MLKKIVSIKNIGRFRNHNATGDVELKRYTLVFAENGRGKTTLCAILRSLQTGDSSYVLGRKMLGAAGAPEVRLLLDGSVAEFNGSRWNTTLPNLGIFDATFISENVYSGDVVDIEHRRSLYRVIVGQQGVALARKIDELDSASRGKATEIREKAAAIQIHVPEGVTLDDFLALQEDPDIDSKIETSEKEREAVREADQIKTRVGLSALSLPEIPDNLAALLATTIEGVAEDAERQIAAQIAAHGMHARGESWLSEGLGYVSDDKCPFCDQSLDGAAALIRAYRAYFSDAYNELRQKIATLRERVAENLSDRRVAAFETIGTQNAAGVEFWARYCDFAPPTLSDARKPGEVLRGLRRAALALLDRKAAAPLEALAPDQALSERYRTVELLEDDVRAYNAAVATANSVIAAQKTETSAADLRTVEGKLARLRAIKKRHEPQVRTACAEYERAKAEKTAIETEKANIRANLDEYTTQVIERYEQTINQLLDDFNAGFRITRIGHGYPGGVASSTYHILINNTPVALGDANTPLDQPSFKNTLSSGDRSTLALAFFLAQLKHDPDRANKIVIFDDPFTSQDSFRRDCTVQKIRRSGEASTQVLVLSHNQAFLKGLWDRLDTQAAERKCLEMTRVGQRDTTICAWDIEEATQAAYDADRRALKDYHLHALGNPREVVQKIRPVLESFCKYVGGGSILATDTLGVIVGKVRDAGSSHVLYPVLEGLDDLNEYTRRYHHGENPNAATEPIDQTELHGFVKKTIDIAGGT